MVDLRDLHAVDELLGVLRSRTADDDALLTEGWRARHAGKFFTTASTSPKVPGTRSACLVSMLCRVTSRRTRLASTKTSYGL